ncbi:TIGR02922 family protein [Thalassotalea psychrophila]|uniref:TIGR02922 family protein n=1 Tax=Thalassotalea psychrophila TaxID=3065647 RepID=A0ABY9TWF8_9GAMM|nr:TIGR02922 family protein [Colwelliaceae bacterium SQ149]
MQDLIRKCVTVIYYDVNTLELNHYVGDFPVQQEGRVVIPKSFKLNKSIVAVCEGEHIPLELEYAN